jgi:hypothetical protein
LIPLDLGKGISLFAILFTILLGRYAPSSIFPLLDFKGITVKTGLFGLNIDCVPFRIIELSSFLVGPRSVLLDLGYYPLSNIYTPLIAAVDFSMTLQPDAKSESLLD